MAIQALRTLNFARSLAEPNLTTLNGKPANFQAGGSFPIPTSVVTAGRRCAERDATRTSASRCNSLPILPTAIGYVCN